MFIEKLYNVGFNEVDRFYMGTYWIIEYKYYPIYLLPNHYNLKIITNNINIPFDYNTANYWLYNLDIENKLTDILFTGVFPFIDMRFNELFGQELRSKTINDILN